MRLTFLAPALVPLILCAAPALAQTAPDEGLLPGFSHDQAMSCLALWVTRLESEGPGLDPATVAQEMVFFARLVAQKSTPDEAATFDSRFAEMVAQFRAWQAALKDPATREEADMDLTETGKMCWFQALAAEGGPYEGQ